MSKKTWILISCLVLSLTLGLGGSLAYLTDSDTRVNTFTMGNVQIEVEENFEPNAQLKPGQTVVKNAWIENTGSNAAWVWMTVAVPSEIADVIVLNWADGVAYDSIAENVKGKDGHTYTVYTVRVGETLAVGATTGNLLESVTMLGTVDYDVDEKKYYKVVAGEKTEIDYDMSKFNVIVTGYAIQDEGFLTVEAAYEAYNNQWQNTMIETAESDAVNGDVDNDETETPEEDPEDEPEQEPEVTWTEVASAEDLIKAVEKGGNVKLARNIETNASFTVSKDKEVVLDLNVYTISKSNNGTLITNNGTLTLQNGEVTGSGKQQAYLIVNNGEMTIDGVKITEGNSGYAISNSGTLTIQGSDTALNNGRIQNKRYGEITVGETTVKNNNFNSVNYSLSNDNGILQLNMMNY